MTETTVWIRLTDFATHYLTDIVARQAAVGVCIALEKAGCAGYMYRVEPVSTVPEDVVVQTVSPVLTLYIPSDSLPRLRGSTLDYRRSQLETKAVFVNPNVQLACGCGDSVELITT